MNEQTVPPVGPKEWLEHLAQRDCPVAHPQRWPHSLTPEEWALISCFLIPPDYDGPMATLDETEKNRLLANVEHMPCDGLIVIAVRDGKVLEAHTAMTPRERALALASVLAALKQGEAL